MTEMNIKKLILVIAAIILLELIAVAFLVFKFSSSDSIEPVEKSVEITKTVSIGQPQYIYKDNTFKILYTGVQNQYTINSDFTAYTIYLTGCFEDTAHNKKFKMCQVDNTINVKVHQ